MSSDDDTIARMEAALQMAKDERARKVERKAAEVQRIAKEKAVEACQVAEERQIAEAQAKVQVQEEERRRAQVEAIKRQKAQAESEVRCKAKAREALGLGLALKGVPKIVRAPEKGKGVERASCNRCTAWGVVCEVSYFLLSFRFFL